MKNKVTLLSTRPLDADLIQRAGERNVNITCESFIRTEPIMDKAVQNQIRLLSKEKQVIIFTSMNAAEVVAQNLEGVSPPWKVYSIGTATSEVVINNFQSNESSVPAYNASSLADNIINDDVRHVTFFGGDRRRDEIFQKLTGHGISVTEITVYKTINTPVRITNHYNGILFFSPSAVESFFSVNAVKNDTVLFAIGSTTAECIRRYSTNVLITGTRPGKKELVEEAIGYFHKRTDT